MTKFLRLEIEEVGAVETWDVAQVRDELYNLEALLPAVVKPKHIKG